MRRERGGDEGASDGLLTLALRSKRWRDAERLVKAVGNGASLRAWVTARPAIDLQLLGGYREEVQ